jgi:hypothetical protein
VNKDRPSVAGAANIRLYRLDIGGTMKMSFVAATFAAIVLVSIPLPALAGQQRTAAQCHDEWKAHRVKHWLKGMRERDYVARCRETISAADEGEPRRGTRWRWWRVRAPAAVTRESTGAAWY